MFFKFQFMAQDFQWKYPGKDAAYAALVRVNHYELVAVHITLYGTMQRCFCQGTMGHFASAQPGILMYISRILLL